MTIGFSVALVTLTIILSCCATAILSYISMAVMIGPWIDTTIVLVSSLLLRAIAHHLSAQVRTKGITLITAGASLGGILAVGFGFAFPTLYFLDPALFNSWLQSPAYFIMIMAALALSAGALGLLIATFFEHKLLNIEQLPFPIGELSYKMIAAQNNLSKSIELATGFFITTCYGITQKVFALPQTITLFTAQTVKFIEIPAFRLPLSELPMLWAIGFVAGHVIAIPLGIGILTKIFITTPAHTIYFKHLNQLDFLLAFGSGMIFYGTLMSLLEIPTMLHSTFKKMKDRKSTTAVAWEHFSLITIALWMVTLAGTSLFLSHFNFSFLSQLYLIAFTAVCVYQLLLIGGKFGIAPMGRYATFVMMPGLLLFGFNAIQATLVSTFVEVCGGVAVDSLFGKKMAQLSDIDSKKVSLFQIIGLVASAFSVGLIFWILITYLGLGTDQLSAQRAQTRALTINVQTFDFFSLIIGALFGSILKDFKINPIMVLGGILMPLDWALVLVLSGLSTFLFKNKEEYYPFWSGVFAANSLWIMLKGVLSR